MAKRNRNLNYNCNLWTSLTSSTAEVDWPVVHDLIGRLDYDNYFTETMYWKIVAEEIKRRDDYACRRCGRYGVIAGLETHHKTYEHHGSEHLFLEELETLCAMCHRITHSRLIEAVVEEFNADEKDEQRYVRLMLNGDVFVPPPSTGPAAPP